MKAEEILEQCVGCEHSKRAGKLWSGCKLNFPAGMLEAVAIGKMKKCSKRKGEKDAETKT